MTPTPIRLIALPALLLSPLAGHLSAQQCDSSTTRTTLGAFAGRRIDSIRIVTQQPKLFPGPLKPLDRLHIRTRDWTIRRLLLFTVGQAIDTERVSESLRRLREEHIFTDVSITARQCSGEAGVTLTVGSRDVWTTRPKLKVAAAGTNTIGFEERNFLGTGRAVTLSLASDQGVLAAVAYVDDPFFLGRDLFASLRYASYGDGHSARAVIENRERSVYDRWTNTLFLATSRRDADFDTTSYSLHHDFASALLGPRVAANAQRVMYALFGAEYDDADLSVDTQSETIGPEDVFRHFRGVDIGFGVRSAHYASVDWLVPHRTIVDVPLGFEEETVVGIGRETIVGQGMAHVDSWFGRMWLPSPTRLVVTDGWVSGYVDSDGNISNGSLRASIAGYQAARGGMWMARVAGERLLYPDPDVRALATVDPLIYFVSPTSRLAETAFTATLERSWHLWSPISSFTLDGALFGALSRREGTFDPDSEDPNSVYATVLGVGLRIVPTTSGVGPVRLDVGWPIARSAQLSRRVFFTVNVAPWLGADRRRDAYRER